MLIVEILQAEALRLGFTLFGTSPVVPPPHLSTYTQWIEAGLHAGMTYLSTERARDRRSNPGMIQPGALALLSAALPYPNPASIPDGPPGEALGRVAAYAWGRDYHDVIPPLLVELIRRLEAALGRPVASRAYTDTGPILERDFAQTAGLGWIGKNTCLISPQHGSYFLIGETFVDVKVEPVQPLVTDHCGTCRRCIEACPTGAILENRTIDSHRCISYQTIENKGPIAPDLRSGIGEWVFGCDICQMVCPWNLRFAGSDFHPNLAPRPEIPRPVLRKELRLTPEAFNLKFRGSPIRRAKRRGYLRNIAVALGNAGDTSAVPDLTHTLKNEPEPLVRAHAAWALGRLGTAHARQALAAAARQETDLLVNEEVRAALEEQTSA